MASLISPVMKNALLATLVLCTCRKDLPSAATKPLEQAADSAMAHKKETIPPQPQGAERMIYVKGGAFHAGRLPNQEGLEAGASVTVAPFFIDATETTVADFLRCVESGACRLPERKWRKGCTGADATALAEHPINCVTWEVAQAFCAWKGGRLPTAPEWEFAARGTDGRKYPWGNEAPTSERTCWDRKSTCPTAQYPAGKSAFGLFDMAGNVAEWTSTSADILPGPGYVIKGGGFSRDPLDTEADDLRSDINHRAAAVEGKLDLGFRCLIPTR